jgi:hypothetical protein
MSGRLRHEACLVSTIDIRGQEDSQETSGLAALAVGLAEFSDLISIPLTW